MISVTALLLQAAISLLLFVQANPGLNASLREQAIEVANQAIKVATEQTTKKPDAPQSPEDRVVLSPHIPIIDSVNGKGGFGTGDSNYILGKYLTTVRDVWLMNKEYVKTVLWWRFDSDTRINVSVLNVLPKDTYYLYVKTAYGTSIPYWVGSIGIGTSTPSITVLSPNGGERWHTGDVYRITWRSSGVSTVNIYLYDSSISGSGSTNYITPNNRAVSATQGYYDWTIPFNITGSANYRIRIDDADATDLSHSDSSNAPFIITDVHVDD